MVTNFQSYKDFMEGQDGGLRDIRINEQTRPYSETMMQALIQHQDSCPKCGLSWRAATEDLHEPIGSMALDQIMTAIMNCDVCQSRFKDVLETIQRIAKARRLNGHSRHTISWRFCHIKLSS